MARGETKPIELAIPMLLPVHELSQKQIAIGIYFNSEAVLLVSLELSLVDLTFPGDVDALLLSFFIADNSKVDLAIVLDELEFDVAQYLVDVKLLLRE
jgi:hypothetical protein